MDFIRLETKGLQSETQIWLDPVVSSLAQTTKVCLQQDSAQTLYCCLKTGI